MMEADFIIEMAENKVQRLNALNADNTAELVSLRESVTNLHLGKADLSLMSCSHS